MGRATADEIAYRRQLGSAIVQLRTIRGLSQADLAGEIPKSEAAVSRWENGKATPTAWDLRRMADIFALPREVRGLFIDPPEGPVSPVAELLRSAVQAGAAKGLGAGGQRREVA